VKRREFIAIVGGAAAWPLAGRAQQRERVRRLGVFIGFSENDPLPHRMVSAFADALGRLGWVEGKKIRIDYRFASGDPALYTAYAAELVGLAPDAILASPGTVVAALREQTRTIPIVFVLMPDPIGLGFVESLARPGGNVTGFTIRTDEPSGKRLELLKRAFPNISRVTVMLDPTSVVTQRQLRATERAAATLGISLVTLPVSTPEELDALGPAALTGSDGLVVLPSGLFWSRRATVIALATAARLPAIYPEREFADDGGLVAYGANIPDAYRRAAGYVDRILRGTKVGDLPIEEASKFDFVLNLRTAKQLELSPSRDFLVAVDEVIE
jgi:putative ABC transport system substrate-binding protein